MGAPAAVAVISHAYWQSSFGGNPAVLGSPIQINDTPFTIVGVISSDFGSAEPAYNKSVFLPASAYPLLNPQEPAYQSLLRDSISAAPMSLADWRLVSHTRARRLSSTSCHAALHRFPAIPRQASS